MELNIYYYSTLKNMIPFIRYLISQKSDITFVTFHNYARTKVDSYDFLTFRENFDFA